MLRWELGRLWLAFMLCFSCSGAGADDGAGATYWTFHWTFAHYYYYYDTDTLEDYYCSLIRYVADEVIEDICLCSKIVGPEDGDDVTDPR